MQRTITKVGTILVAVLIFHAPAFADWIGETLDDMVTNYTGPAYVEGQNRNYLAFGNASFRQVMTKDNLVSINIPKVRYGCGGIDIFGGGVGFMSFDRLVDKLQNVVQAAPAFAFTYAISQLSEQLGVQMKWLESASDLLNQLQLDDCKASKAIATYAVDSISPLSKKGQQEAWGEFLTNMQIATGTQDLYDEVRSVFSSQDDQPTNTDVAHENDDCPAFVNTVFQNHTSLLDYLFDVYSGFLPSEMEALMRGYIGDVLFKVTNNHIELTDLEPCGGENERTFEALIKGDAVENPGTDTNSCRDWSGTNLYVQMSTAINNIFTAINTGNAPDNDDLNLLNMIPFPIMDHIKICYALDAPALLQQLTPAASYGMGYAILTNILNETLRLTEKVKTQIAKSCAQTGTNDLCAICSNSDITAKFNNIRDRLIAMDKKANEQFIAKLQELESTLVVADVLRATKSKTLAQQLTPNKK